MDNKKYIDKVIDHLVKGTKIDYDNDKIHYPFPTLSSSFYSFLLHIQTTPSSSSLSSVRFRSFTEYCKNTFGLTKDEMEYVWYQYGKILLNKIEN
jgi:hypothetical protein